MDPARGDRLLSDKRSAYPALGDTQRDGGLAVWGAASGRCRTWCYANGMSRVISQRELRNESGKIMSELDEGETFIVTRNGVPVGELAPLRRHRFVPAETAVAVFKAAPAIDYQRFRADLDIIASQDPKPRG